MNLQLFVAMLPARFGLSQLRLARRLGQGVPAHAAFRPPAKILVQVVKKEMVS
jgi:hypothetical protein